MKTSSIVAFAKKHKLMICPAGKHSDWWVHNPRTYKTLRWEDHNGRAMVIRIAKGEKGVAGVDCYWPQTLKEIKEQMAG